MQHITLLTFFLLLTHYVNAQYNSVIRERLEIPGSINGAFNVSETGIATYSIPITTPEGINRLTPSIAISYSSTNQNEIMGIGWSLSGLSSITRTSASMFHDKYVYGVNLNDKDRFALDGTRLLISDPQNGPPYGANNCEYRTEQETFSKIISYTESATNGPKYFIVQKPDGTKWHYGNTENSRIEPSGASNVYFIWLLNRIEDIQGNYIDYIYEELNSSGEYYVSEIIYTGNWQQNIAPRYKIKFNYINRTDIDFYYIDNSKHQRKRLLKEIDVINEALNTVLYKYTLNYSNVATQRPTIESITLQDKDMHLLPSTIFNWNKTPTNPTTNNATIPNQIGGLCYPVDYNGDGYTDILQLPEITSSGYSSSDNIRLYINNGNGQFLDGNFSYQLNSKFRYIFTGDFDGDGRCDFLLCRVGTNYAWDEVVPFRATDNGFQQLSSFSYPVGIGTEVSLIPGDFLGYGRMGFLVKTKDNSNEEYYWKICYLKEGVNNYFTSICEGKIGTWGNFTKYGDFNGDGRTDILLVNNAYSTIFTFKQEGQYNDWVIDPYYQSGFPTKWHRIFTGDFNGDGHTDLITYVPDNQKWFISYFRNTNFEEPFTEISVPSIEDPGNYEESLGSVSTEHRQIYRIADFDSDGKDDILVLTNKTSRSNDSIAKLTHTVEPSLVSLKPNGWTTYNFLSPLMKRARNQNLFLGDFNADGKLDFISTKFIFPSLISFETAQANFMYFNTNDKNYTINSITNGYGQTIDIQYDFLTKPNMYENTNYYNFSDGIFDLCTPLLLVKSFSDKTTSNLPVVTTYKYSGAKLHTRGKGFLGFSKITTHIQLYNIYTVKENDLFAGLAYLYPKKHSTYYSQINDSKLLSENIFKYNKVSKSNNIYIYFPALEYSIENKWDEPGSFLQCKINNMEYHRIQNPYPGSYIYYNYANIKSTTSYISTTRQTYFSAGFENYTYMNKKRYNYYTDQIFIDNWLFSLVKEDFDSIVNKGDNITFRHSNLYTYYKIGNKLGLLEKVKDFPAANLTNPLVIEKSFEYDTFGNITKEQTTTPQYGNQSARASQIEYTASGFYTNPTKITTGDLFSTFEYDDLTGQKTVEIDPNTHKTISQTDLLGSSSSITYPLGVETVSRKLFSAGHSDAPENALYYIKSSKSGNKDIITFYNKYNQEVRKVYYGINTNQAIYQNTIYNEKGLVESISEPYFKGSYNILYTRYEYDIFNRIKKVTHPDNTTTTFNYNGLETTKTRAGQILKIIVNEAGLLISTTSSNDKTVINEYYANGNLRKTYNASYPNEAIELFYDDRGQRLMIKDPNAGYQVTHYNPYGEIVRSINSSGLELTYSYDNIGRVTSKEDGTDNLTYEYGTSFPSKGLLEKIKKNGTIINWKTYNSNSMISQESEIFNEGTDFWQSMTKYKYDQYGRISEYFYPSLINSVNAQVRYEYSNGIITKVINSLNEQVLWKTESENAKGQITQFRLGNGLVTTRTYNDSTALVTKIETVSGNTNIQREGYKWDKRGNLTMRTSTRGTGPISDKTDDFSKTYTLRESFTYDIMDMLTSAKVGSNPEINVIYYPNGKGNIASKSNVGVYRYDSDKPNALARISPSFSTTQLQNQYISYTNFDKTQNITEGGNSLSMVYNKEYDRKLVKLNNSGQRFEKKYISNNSEVLGSQSKTRHFISGPDGVFAVVENVSKPTEQWYYVSKDHLGSFSYITNSAGVLVQENNFDPWGNRRDPNTWQPYTGRIVPLMFERGFTGHEHLEPFNLINMNARMYDPLTGYFLRPDNYIAAPDISIGFNRYAYCLNNPLKYTDPDGEWLHLVIGGIPGGIQGYMIADATGQKGLKKFWYTLGGAAIGAATAGIGTVANGSAGIVAGGIAGGIAGGAVSGAGFGTMSGYAAGLRGGSLFNAGFTGMFKGAIAGAMGSVVGGAIGGGWGALAGGATSNLTGQLLSNDFSFRDINWASVGVSSITSLGVYHVSSYANWRSNVKNQNFYGRSIKYNQYLRMQASYTRGKFWGSERAGGGFWLTKNGISRQGVSYDPEHGNVVRFDFSQKPSDAWATFHPHPYKENQVVGGNLWHSPDDMYNVWGENGPNFSSMIINKYGAELLTPVSAHYINMWNYGKPYYIYPWTW